MSESAPTLGPLRAAVAEAVRALEAAERASDPLNRRLQARVYQDAMTRAEQARAAVRPADLSADEWRELAELAAKLLTVSKRVLELFGSPEGQGH